MTNDKFNVDIKMKISEAGEFVNKYGYQKFLDEFNKKYPMCHFYKVSTDWYEDGEQACQLSGKHLDVIVGWEEWDDD